MVLIASETPFFCIETFLRVLQTTFIFFRLDSQRGNDDYCRHYKPELICYQSCSYKLRCVILFTVTLTLSISPTNKSLRFINPQNHSMYSSIRIRQFSWQIGKSLRDEMASRRNRRHCCSCCNKRGADADQLAYPISVVVDRMDTLYIADTDNHCVIHWFKGFKSGSAIIDQQSWCTRIPQLS